MPKFFHSLSQNVSLKKFYEIKNKICILRSCGGLGDIINMRMIFKDIKTLYPEFHITWGVPSTYFAAAKNHPYVDEVVQFGNINQGDYIQIYNLTNACTRYEWARGRDVDKNRADIWADHIGIRLHEHKTFMPDYSCSFKNVIEKLKLLGWDGVKKIVLFAPRSALPIKNLLDFQCNFIKNMTKDFFLVILHNYPILDLVHLQIPMLTGMPLTDAIAAVQLADMVIATDTGLLHVAGGYKKPTLGIFSYTNGKIIAKYYPTVEILQGLAGEDDKHCGPCNNYSNCTETDDQFVKPCMSEITGKMLDKTWAKVLENYTKPINKGASTLI